uniref:Uncharacterized protein n=1 Tax=Gossypium raimondii TaxID=29730 RepID=A0A0D2VYD8_GOSRA|nr:hypothetical protein B456_012G116400 [Gossypium raimondii]
MKICSPASGALILKGFVFIPKCFLHHSLFISKVFSKTNISEFFPYLALLVIDEYVGDILAIFEELSIPCKLVLNVVGIEETEALSVLKSAICVSGFDSSSKFNLPNVVLVLPILKECLGGILCGLLNINSTMPSWC